MARRRPVRRPEQARVIARSSTLQGSSRPRDRPGAPATRGAAGGVVGGPPAASVGGSELRMSSA